MQPHGNNGYLPNYRHSLCQGKLLNGFYLFILNIENNQVGPVAGRTDFYLLQQQVLGKQQGGNKGGTQPDGNNEHQCLIVGPVQVTKSMAPGKRTAYRQKFSYAPNNQLGKGRKQRKRHRNSQ